MTPLDKSAPVPRGAGASPGALHDSGSTPASIARVSRDSITMRSGEARGGFLVFRRFNGLLLGRPLRRWHIAALGIHRRKGFHFRQGIGSRWDFHRRRRGIESAWQPRERALPRVMGERRRGSGLPMATKTADQVFGEFPSARRPARLHPPEARTIATNPARTASDRRCHTAASSARSGGTALDFTLVLCSTPRVFPEVYPVRLNPVRANEIARRSGQAPPERMSSLRWTTASRTGRWVCLLRTAITLMRHAPWLRPPPGLLGTNGPMPG